ncbi:Probable xyloglucan endotransglucosylase/hydrolase protein 32, partial [Striga hermonthica]
MALLVILILLFLYPLGNNGEGPPSPGYYPSYTMGSIGFDQGFTNLWGPQHQRLDQEELTIWLDKTSGSGFKSLNSYSSGYFGASMKVHPGYTAGVDTSLYVR